MPANAPSGAGGQRERRGLGAAEAGHDQDLFAAGLASTLRAARPRTAGPVRPRHRTAASDRGRTSRAAPRRCAGAASASRRTAARRSAPCTAISRRLRSVAREERAASACLRRCTACRRCRARGRSCGCRRRCGSRAASRTAPAAHRRGTQHRTDHLLVGAEHPLRVDDALGPPGRSRREQHLRDRVRADAVARRVDLGR